jgi:hypothetical protein
VEPCYFIQGDAYPIILLEKIFTSTSLTNFD